MPVELVGALKLRKALRNYAPDLAKQLNSELRAAARPVVRDARGFVRSDIAGLHNWTHHKSLTSRTSRDTPFPEYDPMVIKKGIVFSMGKQKANPRGFSSILTIFNKSRVGAIYETAGRLNPSGDPRSQSNNPGAGQHFIRAAGPLHGRNKDRGRLIFRAVEQDRGKMIVGIVKALDKANTKFQRRIAHYNDRMAA